MISFEQLNAKVGSHPYYGDTWKEYSEEKRKSYYDYIVDAIQNHEWRGHPCDTPVQQDAFPRIIDGDYIYWQDQNPPVDHIVFECNLKVLPLQWIIDAVVYMVAEEPFQKQKVMRNLGIKSSTVGPLKQDFEHQYLAVSNIGDPLPKPLWERMKKYSNLYNEVSNPAFVSIPMRLT